MARVYKRNKLGQFSKGGVTSKGNFDRAVSKGSISAKAASAAIENIAVRASSKSSGKGTSSTRVRAQQALEGFKSFKPARLKKLPEVRQI